ncbi:PDZ domain-containing protein, partial [Haematococcus lacustris]
MALRLAKPACCRAVNACNSSPSPRHPCHPVEPRRDVNTRSSANGVTDSLAQEVPPGCSRYTVKLTKPMGLVLQQDTKTLAITIADIKPDGSAAKAPERMCV